MALNIKQDPEQWQQLVGAVNDLSTNVGKWQAATIAAIERGFADLVNVFSDHSEQQQQAIIDQLAANLNLTADEIQAALKQPTQKEK